MFVGSFYLNDPQNIVLGILTVFALAPGAILFYLGLKASEVGFSFGVKGQRRYTGKENTIMIFAKPDSDAKKDIPFGILFLEMRKEKLPKGVRLHYVRNLKKHFFEVYNNTKTNKLEPVLLPDKKSSPPELFKIPATMQPYKDCMDYNPPSLLQKIAPGILLAAMGIVGLLMLVTGG